MKAFANMLQFDVVRGKDSTGIVCVDKNGDISSAKEAWLPTDFLQHRQVSDILKTPNKRILIGHNRHATVGKVNKAGAHPFEFDNVIGVHNGTTPKHNFRDSSDFDVDSEALYNHVDKEGIEDMWNKMSGAASLAFYHKNTRRFHLLRNEERPMYVAFTKDGKTMLFASEPWMIHAIQFRTKVDIDAEKGIKQTTVDQLYSFDPFKDEELTKFSTRKVKPYTRYQVPARKPQKPVLNTWAKNLYALAANQEIQFEITSYQKETHGQLTKFNIESTSTRSVLLGRMYIDPVRDPDTYKDAIDSIEMADTWRGVTSAVSEHGPMAGFIVSPSSAHNEDALDREAMASCIDASDIKDALIIDNTDGFFTREQFDKQDGLHNLCQFCNDPLNYDAPETFKCIGKTEGKLGFVCETCEEEFKEVDFKTFIDAKIVRNISEYVA